MKYTIKLLFSIFLMTAVGCGGNAQTKRLVLEAKDGMQTAVFAEGCFWCAEHIFEDVPGVSEAISGYAGGTTKNPSYEQVGAHTTGHAEAVLVYYDPKVINYQELVNVFFASHDPTTLNKQGPDVGDSYRSVAFYENDEQKKIIENTIKKLEASNAFSDKIVTQVEPIKDFYEAESYHQDYIKHNPNNPYVHNVSIPRYNKFRKTYKGKLKDN